MTEKQNTTKHLKFYPSHLQYFMNHKYVTCNVQIRRIKFVIKGMDTAQHIVCAFKRITVIALFPSFNCTPTARAPDRPFHGFFNAVVYHCYCLFCELF